MIRGKKIGSGMFPHHWCNEKLCRDCFLVTQLFHGGVVTVIGTAYWYCCWRIEIDYFRCLSLIVNTNSCFAEHARSWKRTRICVAVCRCWCLRGLLTTGQGSRSRSRLPFQSSGSGFVTFWYGSGSADPYLWLTEPDPDPAIFVSDLQDGT
jgi:hypothetical protein